MTALMRSACDERVAPSTCENPQFPSWTWRYNRNKCLSRYDPWYIRDERMAPNYRNMGVHSNFRFHPLSPDEVPRPFQSLGVNYCHDAVRDRVAGFGNSAIGRTPGPAPPRLILYSTQTPFQTDDLYRVNEIHNISAGMSLIGPTTLGMAESDHTITPLNPSHYLEQTLGQPAQIPGAFPHFNKPLPISPHNTPGRCHSAREAPRDLMAIWRQNYGTQLAGHAQERHCCLTRSAPSPVATPRRHCIN